MRHLKNIFSSEAGQLYIVQLANFAIPLVVFPYLTRTLGLNNFGKYGFGLTLFFLFSFFIEFGFNFSGSRRISIDNERKFTNLIFTNIQFIRFTIFLICVFISLIIYFSRFFDINDSKIIVVASILSFSSVLTPSWFFNGIAKNSVVAKVTLFFKIVFIIPIFFLVNSKDDYILALVLQGLPAILVGIVLLYYIRSNKLAAFKFNLMSLSEIRKFLKDSFDNFVGSLFTLSHTYLVPIIIKIILGDSYVGIYTALERIMGVIRQLYVPIQQAYFAKVSLLFEQKQTEEIKVSLIKILKIYLSIGFVSLVGNICFGSYLLPVILGQDFQIHHYLNIAIITQIVISMAIILTSFIIIPAGKSFILKYAYACSTIIFFLFIMPCAMKFGIIGVLSLVLWVEVILTLFFLIYTLSIKKSLYR
ncbi:MAG: hypothetical protein DI627_06550 [Acinetobacter sp.]|uniref:oligosaccharide flippase family protein n=1 Tax=Acinetobacter TaxID=469 RepID=UPI000DB473F8|nr:MULTISPECIES: lipopolysaccharide biosynthesis protein [Acinetobacter]PZT87488.1 MAG: hypothetical protein DI627_06550 [Acinetobacter sp.]RSO81663.1 lipopolysaccharide biosynthesis protein [Acinetobacter ursingii]